MSSREVVDKLAAALAAAQAGDWADVIIVSEGAQGTGWVGYSGSKVRALGLLAAATAVITNGVVNASTPISPDAIPTLGGGGIKVN